MKLLKKLQKLHLMQKIMKRFRTINNIGRKFPNDVEIQLYKGICY